MTLRAQVAVCLLAFVAGVALAHALTESALWLRAQW